MDRVLVGDLEEAAAGLRRDTLQHFLAIGATGLRRWIAAASASHSRPTEATQGSSAVITVLIGKQYRINQGLGTLGRFDALRNADLTASVHTIGQQDESLPPRLFFHQLV